jgi:uncharacterized cupin superfamily protein
MPVRPNFDGAEFEYDDTDPEGFRSGIARVGAEAGGSELAVKLFEIPSGQSLCPYHYEYVEEWLIVLSGEIELRTPAGIEQLHTGDIACFPAGPDGAHKTTNHGATPARVVMFSSAREPAVAVYPDGDKIGVWVPGGVDNVMLRRADGRVPYYDGEG